jgi:hypothetical protein
MKTMIDTVKLLITVNNPLIFDGSRFAPITLEQLVNSTNYGKTALNPSATYAKMGKYMPRLTMFKRPSRFGAVYQLAVEFSAPKLVFGNNFDELTDADFEAVLDALQNRLHELLGYRFFRQVLAQAEVGAWHPSKNIVFLDYTSCQTVLNAIGKLDVSRMYDLQKTDFRDGHVVHIHCNSLDIAMYDKMADLRKSKVSDKRAFEKDNVVQLNLLEQLEEYRPLEVFRYEVRLNGKAAIKRAFPEIEQRTFENLFRQELCQANLLKHWHKLTSSVDMLSLDVRKPYELLQNYLIDNPDATPQAAMAAVTGLLISGQEGVVGLRNLLDASYGRQAWSRIKKLLKAPSANRFTHFQHIDEALERFTPTKLSQFENNIANTSKL